MLEMTDRACAVKHKAFFSDSHAPVTYVRFGV